MKTLTERITITESSNPQYWGGYTTDAQGEEFARRHAEHMRQWALARWPDADVVVEITDGEPKMWAEGPDADAVLQDMRDQSENTWTDAIQ